MIHRPAVPQAWELLETCFLFPTPAPLNQDPRSNKIPGDCSARWLRGNGELQTAFGRDVAAFSLLFHTARMKFKQ